MPSTLFEQARIINAQIKANYFSILHENEELRKHIQKLTIENDKLKSDIAKANKEISTTDSGRTS